MGCIGVITHLLTIDPNFQRDIQASHRDSRFSAFESLYPVWTHGMTHGFNQPTNVESTQPSIRNETLGNRQIHGVQMPSVAANHHPFLRGLVEHGWLRTKAAHVMRFQIHQATISKEASNAAKQSLTLPLITYRVPTK